MNRRALFRTASSVVLVSAVSACAGTTATTTVTVPTIVTSVITDVQAIATGLVPVLSTIDSSAVSLVVTTLSKSATDVANITTAIDGRPIVSSIIGAVTQIVEDLPGLGIPASILSKLTPLLSAAQSLLPILATYVALVGATTNLPPPVLSESEAVRKLLGK